MKKIKVVLGQLGSPKSPSVRDVRTFLREFLGDPRVVDLTPWLWKIILYLFVLPFRPKKSAQAYARIWNPQRGFPLVYGTHDFYQKLKPLMNNNIELEYAFLLTEPRIKDRIDAWEKENFNKRANELYILPQFPQYAESTVASVIDLFAQDAHTRVNLPSLHIINSFHSSKAFIDSSVKRILETINQNTKIKDLVISFHGIPLRRVTQKKDIYYQHCVETFYLIKNNLDRSDINLHLTFQSRFGSEVWLGPYTDEYTKNLATKGVKDIAIYCPSFVVDCLETTDEIGTELKHEIKELGSDLIVVPCLNDCHYWVESYAQYINTLCNGNNHEKENLFYETKEEWLMEKEIKVEAAKALTVEQKRSLKIVFVTLFLDLMGFSIIFPLFPALAKYYLEVDPDNYFLKLIFDNVSTLTSVNGNQFSSIVLFGGILGALYSLLQFIFAPMWGGLSDKIGRRPVLVTTVTMMLISYALWIFSGSFTLLILSRLIGGVASGNLSTASAVVADITDKSNRSKGMAIIGIAFALGFVLGPAMGGISSLFNPLNSNPNLAQFGVNPFSFAALVAFILTLMNLLIVLISFKETLTEENKAKADDEHRRSNNPIKIFKPLENKLVNIVNYSYFIFISSFAGMEFTLTFLAADRFQFSSMQNAYMFIFIGFILAMVQGGYVRRKAHQVGEKKIAMRGLSMIIPGLIIISFAQSVMVFYIGLFFLAVGSAMTIPTLTTLVSLLSPSHQQGVSLGVFRSLGSLGRVVGPLLASFIYFSYGNVLPYWVGGAMLIIPIWFLTQLKEVK
jgi:ferrochelatase